LGLDSGESTIGETLTFFRDTMQKLIETPILEYKNLIAA